MRKTTTAKRTIKSNKSNKLFQKKLTVLHHIALNTAYFNYTKEFYALYGDSKIKIKGLLIKDRNALLN